MKISLIAAIGKNRELGRDNKLIFQIPEDMKSFREKTRGHVVIMGRKTFDSIGRPLPDRTNIVITNNLELRNKNLGVKFATSIEDALEIARKFEDQEAFIIGGEQIYKLALPFADKLYLTIVHKTVKDADAFFPDYSDFTKVLFERQSKDKNYSYTFLDLAK